MANQSQGDGRAVNWSFPLPPKSPAFPSSASGPVLDSTAAGRSSVVPIHGGVHKRNPSAGYLSQTQSTWVDELVDAPEGPFKRGSHRRSASESMVFLDGHTSLAKVADENITEDEEFDSQRTASMHSQRGPTTVAKPDKPSTPSDSNSLSEVSNEEVRARGPEMLRGEPEVQSTRDGDRFSQPFSNGELQQALAGLDSTIDVKRAKRILANRQSAQRSRVRKLQYISELERSVTALQAEITAMAPQVAFYEHRRAILNMDNNTIKQKMAAIVQGQLFKDAHNEGLKTELQRLRQLYQQQQLQQPQQQTTPSPGYECQQQEFNNLDLGASHQSELNMVESDAFPAGLMNSSGEQPICDGSDILSPTLAYSRSLPHGLNGMMPTSCMLPGNGKSLEGMMMGEYMVHNS
ncbi:unnamed protein product [Sphagnum balticum]